MKALIILILVMSLPIWTAPVEKPIPVVKLKPQMTITYQEGDFYFKHPLSIKIADDGSIFLIDDKQFLKFNASGKFLANQQKAGEGPGEIIYIGFYQLLPGKIIIYSGQPSKIIVTTLDGTLLQEYKISKQSGPLMMVNLKEDHYWAFFPNFEFNGKPMNGFMEVNSELCSGTFDGKIKKTGIFFKEKYYLISHSAGKNTRLSLILIDKIHYAATKTGILFVANSPKYAINRIDLGEGKNLGEISAPYESVRYSEKPQDKDKPKSTIPTPEYFNDIQKLIMGDNILWVLTSKVVEGKGILVDQYSETGEHRKRFFLDLPQVTSALDIENKPITLYKDSLFTVETDDEDNPVVVKYEILYDK